MIKVNNLPLFFLVFIVAALAILVAYLISSIPQETEEEEPETKECSNGEIRDCMKGPCNGTQNCSDGMWGSCTVERICEPGEVVPCAVDSCASAYKICNDCGTGYGECIGKNGS